MGKIFYIMGKSASGKDRIYSLLAAHKELNLKTLILYTTRPIRAGEQDGKNYYFVDDGNWKNSEKTEILSRREHIIRFMGYGLISLQMMVR